MELENLIEEMEDLAQERLRKIELKNQTIKNFKSKLKNLGIPKFKIQINDVDYNWDQKDLWIFDKEANVYKNVLASPIRYREKTYDNLKDLISFVKGLL